MATEVQGLGNAAVSPEEAYAELEAVLRSPLFKRAEKLERFLRFIFDTTMQGDAAHINEHLIGLQVFRRGPEYNPGEDSIVRRTAHAMRQKLQEYYATEGVDHPIRIDIPVGRYVPVLRRLDPPQSIVPAPPPRVDTSKPLLTRFGWVFAAVAVFTLGWAGAGFASRVRPKGTPVMREIWAPWIGNPVVLCLSNPTSAFVRQWVNAVPSENLSHGVQAVPGQEPMFRNKFSMPNGGRLYFLPTVAQTMMGEASAATQFAAMFGQTGGALHPMESRFLSWENLRRENHILFGGDAENHWVDSILENYPFRMATPSDGAARSIVNTKPQAGDPASYFVHGSEETREEYALLSMLPGLGANHQFLILCGLNSPALPLATEYLTTEPGLAQLTKRLREAAPHHAGIWHFQTVVKVILRDKVPTRSSIVALRVL